MPLRRTLALATAAGLSLVMAAPALAAPSSAVPASSSPSTSATTTTAPTGTRSLAALLTSDGNTFDRNWYDYDIVTQAVLAVVAAKPNSPVKVLTDGRTPVTAFLPNDRAFQVFLYDLTKKWVTSEKGVFDGLVAAAGVNTIETILLYHVVPGVTITSSMALASNGAKLTTALPGATITVDVVSRWFGLIRLKDNDRNAIDPFLNPFSLNLNRGNKQIAHGILAVLRPVDLP